MTSLLARLVDYLFSVVQRQPVFHLAVVSTCSALTLALFQLATPSFFLASYAISTPAALIDDILITARTPSALTTPFSRDETIFSLRRRQSELVPNWLDTSRRPATTQHYDQNTAFQVAQTTTAATFDFPPLHPEIEDRHHLALHDCRDIERTQSFLLLGEADSARSRNPSSSNSVLASCRQASDIRNHVVYPVLTRLYSNLVISLAVADPEPQHRRA